MSDKEIARWAVHHYKHEIKKLEADMADSKRRLKAAEKLLKSWENKEVSQNE